MCSSSVIAIGVLDATIGVIIVVNTINSSAAHAVVVEPVRPPPPPPLNHLELIFMFTSRTWISHYNHQVGQYSSTPVRSNDRFTQITQTTALFDFLLYAFR